MQAAIPSGLYGRVAAEQTERAHGKQVLAVEEPPIAEVLHKQGRCTRAAYKSVACKSVECPPLEVQGL